jgi:hypothetical protein
MFCYLWVHKKNGLPYLGIVNGNKIDHPDLIIENRSRMKILLIDPTRDLPIETINSILKIALGLPTTLIRVSTRRLILQKTIFNNRQLLITQFR